MRIEVARDALYDALNNSVYDHRPGVMRPEVPDTHEDRRRLKAMSDAQAEGPLYVTNVVNRRMGTLRPTVHQAARAVELLMGRDDEASIQAVLDKVTDALHELSRLRIQMRIEIGTSDPEELYYLVAWALARHSGQQRADAIAVRTG